VDHGCGLNKISRRIVSRLSPPDIFFKLPDAAFLIYIVADVFRSFDPLNHSILHFGKKSPHGDINGPGRPATDRPQGGG
jgi:hypothetical protein